jgi:hypothetical protein
LGHISIMRVRCTFCGADYEAPVTRAALVLVGRCEYCRRERLEPVDDDAPPRPLPVGERTGPRPASRSRPAR